MDEEFLYKTKAPKGIYIYPIIFFFIALAFMYYDVPILTTYFYLVIAGIILYIIYIIRNPLPSIVSVYTDKIILSKPFRLRKNIVYYYKDIHCEFVISVYSIDFIYFWKRYIVSCSFLYGEEAKALNLNLLPNLREFAIALSIIRHKLRLYQKSISDILSEGSEETGAHLVSLLERDGLKKDEIVELYKSENISQEVVETHFAELEEMKDREIDEFKKDYSAGGYLMLGIGILFIFFSIILQNGRIIPAHVGVPNTAKSPTFEDTLGW